MIAFNTPITNAEKSYNATRQLNEVDDLITTVINSDIPVVTVKERARLKINEEISVLEKKIERLKELKGALTDNTASWIGDWGGEDYLNFSALTSTTYPQAGQDTISL